MPTIKDVADAAGVSIATVSNYLNRTKPVSPETERKIKEAIGRLKYAPNSQASSLKSRRYNDVGVILPNLSDPYYSQIYQGVELGFQNSSYFLNLSFSYDIPDIEENIVYGMLKKNICGLILVSCRPDGWRFYYDRFTSRDKPLVLIDRLIDNLNATFVTFDYASTLKSITSGLIRSGNRNIYLFAGPESFSCERECKQGYLRAFELCGLTPDPRKAVMTVITKEEAFRQTIRLLKNDRPDVIVTTSELSSMGIVEALTLLGYSTPGDIPVVTLGEQHWNRYTHTFASFSTVRPAMQLGGRAAELLKEQIASPRTFEKQHIMLSDRVPEVSLAAKGAKERPKAAPIRGEINVLMLETSQVDAVVGILPHFEHTTGIRANVEILPHRFLYERILNEHERADSRTDVYMFDMPWLYSLASMGVLADITGYIQDPSFNAGMFLPDCLKYFSEFDGKYYGLPFMYAPQIFYYRKDLFDNPKLRAEYERLYHSKLRPPLTWTEFNAIAEFFTEYRSPENLVSYGTSIPTAYKECMVPEIYMRMWAYGAKIYDGHGEAFDSPQTLKAYVNYKGTFKYAKPDYRTATDSSVVTDFINGETAMLITYPSFLTGIVDLRRSSLTGSIGYSHIPGRSPILGGWSVGISALSEKKDAAFKFISWASTEENANYFTLLGGQPAVTSLFTNDELTKLYPWLPLYHSVYKYARPVVPPHAKGKPIISQDMIDSILCKWATRLIEDELDVASAIKNTGNELSALFRGNGYL